MNIVISIERKILSRLKGKKTNDGLSSRTKQRTCNHNIFVSLTQIRLNDGMERNTQTHFKCSIKFSLLSKLMDSGDEWELNKHTQQYTQKIKWRMRRIICPMESRRKVIPTHIQKKNQFLFPYIMFFFCVEISSILNLLFPAIVRTMKFYFSNSAFVDPTHLKYSTMQTWFSFSFKYQANKKSFFLSSF